jgi:hypothetical protein
MAALQRADGKSNERKVNNEQAKTTGAGPNDASDVIARKVMRSVSRRGQLRAGEQKRRPDKQPPAQGARLGVTSESHATHNALTNKRNAIAYFRLDAG